EVERTERPADLREPHLDRRRVARRPEDDGRVGARAERPGLADGLQLLPEHRGALRERAERDAERLAERDLLRLDAQVGLHVAARDADQPALAADRDAER